MQGRPGDGSARNFTADPAAEDREQTLTIDLAEYGSLKDEQGNRIERRDHLVYANLTAIAAVLLGAGKNPAVLLLLPMVSLILGWTHLTNDLMVTAIGRYVRDDLGGRLARRAGARVLGWEHEHPGDRRRRQRKRIQLAVDLGAFVVPALGALVGYVAVGHPPVLGWVAAAVQLVPAAILAHQQVVYAATDRPRS